MAVLGTILTSLATGTGLDEVTLGPWTLLLAAETVVVFLFAGLFAWLTLLPRPQLAASVDSLRAISESIDFWNADPRIGTRRVAESYITLLATVRAANGLKAWNIQVAMGLIVLSIILLAVTLIAYINGI